MTNSRIAEVLYDSETMLRLVDSELDELRDDSREPGLRGNNIGVLLAAMQRATGEIAQVLCTLHTSREALQGVTLQEIHDSATKLGEVCTATELAATRMMDGLERAHALVDELDELGSSDLDSSELCGDRTNEAATIRARIRDELFAVMGSLQFQDITAQQLGHVSQMLRDIECRLQAISSLLSGGHADEAIMASNQLPTFSESASTKNSFERQATADALFWGDHSARVSS